MTEMQTPRHRIIDYPATFCLVCTGPGTKVICEACLGSVPAQGGLMPKLRGNPSGAPYEQRLWPFVAPTSLDGCWPWTGGTVSRNRGRIDKDGRGQYVHKLVWEMLNGPVPDGLELDHLCLNPNCVNPRHLEAVTHQENSRRAGLQTHNSRTPRTHCAKGHALTPENVYVPPGRPQYRYCVTCRQNAKNRISLQIRDDEIARQSTRIAELEASQRSDKARIEELEANERAYEAVLGQQSYNEVAEHIEELTGALTDCVGCVSASEAEGLHEIIAELRGRDELTDRLIDLVERRLLWVRTYGEEALPQSSGVARQQQR